MLTTPQKKVLEAINALIHQKGYAPSIREICSATGHRSSSTVHGLLTRLSKKGYITWERGNPRTIRILERFEETI